jgi:hypothetical protein
MASSCSSDSMFSIKSGEVIICSSDSDSNWSLNIDKGSLYSRCTLLWMSEKMHKLLVILEIRSQTFSMKGHFDSSKFFSNPLMWKGENAINR